MRIIALDGRSGSGKTSLAGAVARAWDAPVVSMDSIYPGWSGLAAAPPLLVTHVLHPLARGEQPVVPTWDWLADRPGPLLSITVGERLVVEGCGSSVGEASALEGTRIWLDGPAELRRQRAIDRDGPLFEEHWEMWAQQEAALFAADRTRERAHLAIEMSSDTGPSGR
ncbi:para-aminobenzoate synthase [Janibacter sp. Soil728]|nr:para-aminobenzoate synthase [Janibacter sp. Soil728]